MHDDVQAWPPARRGVVTIDLGRGGASVTNHDGTGERVSMAAHREDVLRRLLHRGLSPRVLSTMLPEFRPLIRRLTDA